MESGRIVDDAVLHEDEDQAAERNLRRQDHDGEGDVAMRLRLQSAALVQVHSHTWAYGGREAGARTLGEGGPVEPQECEFAK